MLDDLRDYVLPAAAQGHDVDVMVTGDIAFETDVSHRIQHRMLWFIGAVIGLAFQALTVVFRSRVVPLKAAALNLISIGAAYGVMVAIFQWGWGAERIGVHETVPIMPIAPLLSSRSSSACLCTTRSSCKAASASTTWPMATRGGLPSKAPARPPGSAPARP